MSLFLIILIPWNEINQYCPTIVKLGLRRNYCTMIFSKSFGYALRGVLYVAVMSCEKKKISIDEIAETLAVPKHFLGKIMNKIVKAEVLNSTKGPNGGFSINKNTLSTRVVVIFELTDGGNVFTTCALGLKNCNPEHPCPLHSTTEKLKSDLYQSFTNNTISDLLSGDRQELILSMSTR